MQRMAGNRATRALIARSGSSAVSGIQRAAGNRAVGRLVAQDRSQPAPSRSTLSREPQPTNQRTAAWKPEQVIARLKTTPEAEINWLDEITGWFTTPLKRLTGWLGWDPTGWSVTGAQGVLVYDAGHSSDGFYTLDVRLERFIVGGVTAPTDPPRYLRVEVEPDRPAHDICARGLPRRGDRVHFGGPVVTDHDGAFLEVHPVDEFSLDEARRGPWSSPDPVVVPKSDRPPLLDPGEFEPWFSDADQLQP
jgi:hypothetical protein